MTFPLVLPPLQVHYDLLQEGWGEKKYSHLKFKGIRLIKEMLKTFLGGLSWQLVDR